MARSRRKTPITGITCARSEKSFKQDEHQRERAGVRTALANGDDPPPQKAYGNPWAGPKDGKQYLRKQYLRELYPKLMRK